MIESLDFNDGFYFSHVYDLTNSLQRNCVRSHNAQEVAEIKVNESVPSGGYNISDDPPLLHFNDTFLWNYKMIFPFAQSLRNPRWIVPVIHGYVEQMSKLAPEKQ